MTDLDGLSMWDAPAEDITIERVASTKALAEAAVEPLWPYLSAASTQVEFESRLALAQPNFLSSLAHVVTDPSMDRDQMRVVATSGLSQRFAEVLAQREANEAAQRLSAALTAASKPSLGDLQGQAYDALKMQGWSKEEDRRKIIDWIKGRITSKGYTYSQAEIDAATDDNAHSAVQAYEETKGKTSAKTAGDSVEVSSARQCDICQKNQAAYDGKTQFGPWANMCEGCFKQHGVGLGTGKGQRLIVKDSALQAEAEGAMSFVHDYKPGSNCPYCGADSAKVKQTAKAGTPLTGVDRYKCDECLGGMSDMRSYTGAKQAAHKPDSGQQCPSCHQHEVHHYDDQGGYRYCSNCDWSDHPERAHTGAKTAAPGSVVTWYRNKHMGHQVGIVDGVMKAGQVYTPTSANPDIYVLAKGGVDGVDGTAMDPQHWTQIDTLPIGQIPKQAGYNFEKDQQVKCSVCGKTKAYPDTDADSAWTHAEDGGKYQEVKQAGLGDALHDIYEHSPLSVGEHFYDMAHQDPDYGLFGPHKDHTFTPGQRVNVHSQNGAWGDEPQPGTVVSIDGEHAQVAFDYSGLTYPEPIDRLTPLAASRHTATKRECSECSTPYDFNRASGRVVYHVPSNGVQGQRHKPAHDETVDAVDDGTLWQFDCPVCGYAESEYVDSGTAQSLSSLQAVADKHRRDTKTDAPNDTPFAYKGEHEAQRCSICNQVDCKHKTSGHVDGGWEHSKQPDNKTQTCAKCSRSTGTFVNGVPLCDDHQPKESYTDSPADDFDRIYRKDSAVQALFQAEGFASTRDVADALNGDAAHGQQHLTPHKAPARAPQSFAGDTVVHLHDHNNPNYGLGGENRGRQVEKEMEAYRSRTAPHNQFSHMTNEEYRNYQEAHPAEWNKAVSDASSAVASLVEASEREWLEAEAAFFHHPKSDVQSPHPSADDSEMSRERASEQQFKHRQHDYFSRHPNESHETISGNESPDSPRRQPHMNIPAMGSRHEGVGSYGGGEVPDDLAQAAAKHWFGERGQVKPGHVHQSRTAPDGGSYKISGTRISGGGEWAMIYANTKPSSWSPEPYMMEFYDGSGGGITPNPEGGWTYTGMGGPSHFASRRQAVNENAYGADRYLRTPNPATPAWISDEWGPDGKVDKKTTEEGLAGGADKPMPFNDLQTVNDTRHKAVREAALRLVADATWFEAVQRNHEGDDWYVFDKHNRRFVDGPMKEDDARAKASTLTQQKSNSPGYKQAAEQPAEVNTKGGFGNVDGTQPADDFNEREEKATTTKPRQMPKSTQPNLVTVETEIAPGQMGGGGGFDMGFGADPGFGGYGADSAATTMSAGDPMAPSVDQMVAAKVARLASRVRVDNPDLSPEQARTVAAHTIATYPEMVQR